MNTLTAFRAHCHQAIRAACPNVFIYAQSGMLAMIGEGAGETRVELMDKLTEGTSGGTGLYESRSCRILTSRNYPRIE